MSAQIVKLFIITLSLLLCPLIAAAQHKVEDVKQAVARVKKETGGQVLSTSEKTVDGRRVFRIKLLDRKGVVRYVDVQAAR